MNIPGKMALGFLPPGFKPPVPVIPPFLVSKPPVPVIPPFLVSKPPVPVIPPFLVSEMATKIDVIAVNPPLKKTNVINTMESDIPPFLVKSEPVDLSGISQVARVKKKKILEPALSKILVTPKSRITVPQPLDIPFLVTTSKNVLKKTPVIKASPEIPFLVLDEKPAIRKASYTPFETIEQVALVKKKKISVIPFLVKEEPIKVVRKISTPPVEKSTRTPVQPAPLTSRAKTVTIPKKKTAVTIQDVQPTILKEITGKSEIKNVPTFLIDPEVVQASPKANLSGVFENLDTGFFPSKTDDYTQDWGWELSEPPGSGLKTMIGSTVEAFQSEPIAGIDPKIILLGALSLLLLLMRK